MKHKNWFWGIFFILSAVFVIGSQVGAFGKVGFMTILATVTLIAILVQSLFHLNFFGILTPLAFLYELYYKTAGLPHVSLWILLLAAVLGSLGLSMLFRNSSQRRWIKHHGKVWSGDWSKHDRSNADIENIDDNNPYAKVSFGSRSEYLHADALKSGKFDVSFGSLQIYFDQVTLDPQGAEIIIDCSFGEAELYFPRQWKVIDNLHVSFGDVENNVHDNQGDGALQITLKGTVTCGNVEINYV